jgi:hypothetical protein
VRPQPTLAFVVIGIAMVACDNMADQPKRLPFELLAAKTAEPHWPAVPPAGIVARDDQPEPVPAPT